MAVVLGVSSGFVTTAPTADPNGSANTGIDGLSVVTKDTSPSTAVLITEIGWWRNGSTDGANWEVALYSQSAGVADVRLYIEPTNSSTSTGWLRRSVTWPITPSTAYWLGLQMDAHTGTSVLDGESSGGAGRDTLTGQTALNNPYGGGAVGNPVAMFAIYALVTPFVPAWGAKATSIIGGAF